MRRFIALIIMLVVPLQFAWSAASGLHGHKVEDVVTPGMVAHGHDHGYEYHSLDTDSQYGEGQYSKDQHSEDQHSSHCHHVMSFILPDAGLMLGSGLSGVSNPHPPAVFFTHTPTLPERPPLARA